MHLKVGELARRTGLTVRTLHHYDEIGLLKPSVRSEAGYRMYAAQDVARLHAIQALRHLGLALGEIATILDGRNARPEAIIDQQMQALQRRIREATELHDRLALLREGILAGRNPDIGDWVESLSLMATFGKYFSAGELKTIFTRYAEIEREWLALLPEVRVHMDAGGAIDSPQGQALTRRWTQLMMRWMRGDFALMERWGAMYRARALGAGPARRAAGRHDRVHGARDRLPHGAGVHPFHRSRHQGDRLRAGRGVRRHRCGRAHAAGRRRRARAAAGPVPC